MGSDLQVLLTVAVVLIGVGVGYVAHKCRRMHVMLFESEILADERSNNLYIQLENLFALDKDLKLPGGLPPTRGWAGSPDFLRHVHRIATQMRPQTIVECSSGTSTVVLARTAQILGHGHVYSLEHEPNFARKTRAELQLQGLQQFATVLDAPLRRYDLSGAPWQWYEMAGLPASIDLLVVDGPPSSTQAQARYPALALLDSRIAATGRVVLDDAARPDEFAVVARWKSEFNYTTDEELIAEKGIAFLKRQDA